MSASAASFPQRESDASSRGCLNRPRRFHVRSWLPTPPITLAILPSTNFPTLAISVSLVLASVEPAELLAELPELMNIRAGVLPSMPM